MFDLDFKIVKLGSRAFFYSPKRHSEMSGFLKHLSDSVETLRFASDSISAWGLGLSLFGAFGEGYMSYGVTDCAGEKIYAYKTNFTNEMLTTYARDNQGPDDYIAAYAIESQETLLAYTGERLVDRNLDFKKQRTDAWLEKFGVRAILAQPFRERGLVSCIALFLTSTSVIETFSQHEIKRLFCVAAMLFRSVYDYSEDPESYMKTPNMKKYGILSSREREALSLLANGFLVEAISHKMGVKPVTVGKHFQSAKKKLGARSRDHALAIALRRGLVCSDDIES